MLPTEADINVYNSLDEKIAVEHFLNKSLEDAEEMLRKDSAYYQEDLMWMGPKAFQFYLQAVVNYLQSDYSTGDAQFLDSIYQILMFRLEQRGVDLVRKPASDLAMYVINNYQKFDVDQDVYGDLLGQYRDLYSRLAR